ncbi:MAG: hypothetical protein NZR01_12865 [Bryobacteraceae bacterium]|nr:hypothetical protein [Bryobacteraceae bacterium]
MISSRFWLLSAFLLCLPAAARQATSTGFNRPPAGVDEALRARVQQFYDLEQQGRFRLAEQMVCEDSRDRYYDMEKRRWTSFELIQISYEENFTRARVAAALGTEMATLTGAIPVKAPITTLWRLENNTWCRYFPDPQKEGYRTPFGIMKPSQPGSSSQGGNPMQTVGHMPRTAEDVMAMFEVSRSLVTLPGKGGTEEVELQNRMASGLSVTIHPPLIDGFEAAVSPQTIPANGKAVLRLVYRPKEGNAPPPRAVVRLIAEPIGAEKIIEVNFTR